MFGLGTWEIVIILIVALIFIGPDKLPQVARSIGKGMKQVRSAMNQVDHQVRKAADDFVNAEERREAEAGAQQAPHEDDDGDDDGDEDQDEDQDEDEDDHPVLRAPPESPQHTPLAPPGALAEGQASESAPGSSDADAAGEDPAPRDWRAHLKRPVEGRVAAARPGRRPFTVRGDPRADPADDDTTDGEPS